MEVVVVRPPLVYGPSVKANFRGMMKWLERGIPLPLGAVNNQRSLVALGNLVDLLEVCARHPDAAGETFLVSDGEDLSTTQLLRRLGNALGRTPFLLPVPVPLLIKAASLVNRSAVAQRLCGWLQVDIAHNREKLGWAPPMTVEEGFLAAARSFKTE
jgi:nucleoside-diphosphate-sugar epimerase